MATISSLLADHVSLQVRSVDRLFLQGYVPRLMTEGQVIRFLLDRGFPIPSPAVLGKIGRDYVNRVNEFIAANEIPTVRFVKGDVKEEIAREHFQRAEREGRYGVVMVGIAQEKTSAWRGWRDGGPDGHPHFVYRRQSIFPNNYYFYIRDPDWGPAFIKTVAYAPFPVWIYLNGNEWAKQQAAQQGIAFRALDNGFASCEDPEALAGICHSLSAEDVRLFFERWQAALPSPLTVEDRRRGYGHALAFRQLEISDTRMFDRPAAGRAWFEATLPDQLTLGRPDQAAVIFGRRVTRRTPGRFHTKIFNRGVEAAIQIHFRASKVKQYFKEGRALRTETTINDTRDFGVGRLLTDENWNALIDIGHQINQRLLDHQLDACACAPDATLLERVVLPSTTHDGLPAPGLRFGEPQNDGAARLPVLLPAPVRRADEPHTARADRRADPRLRRAADDLRPPAPAPQRVHPADPPHPTLRAHQRGTPTGRLLHQDLHADRQPIPRRTRPRTPQRDRRPITTRHLVARVRTRNRGQNQTGRYRGLKDDSFVNPSTA